MATADNSTSASDQRQGSGYALCSSSKRRRLISAEGNASIWKLADDLIVEILIRALPNPRSACRCKLVCKRWSSLIFDPVRFNRRFISYHRSRNQQPPLLLHSDDPQSIITSFLPMSRLSRMSFAVMDSYKDLVLCGFEDVGPTSGELYRTYFLCNPFTKEWLALPLAPELPAGCPYFFTRLVCEPRMRNDLDLGDNQVFAYSSEYRFRVVRLYPRGSSAKLDVFCSDTGEWTKDRLVIPNHYQCIARNVVSCNGELFWSYAVPNQDKDAVCRSRVFIAAFNPFRPDIPPTAIDAPEVFCKPGWDISVSQGALHAIASSVWRLEQDSKSWRKVCDGLLKKSRLYELHHYLRPCLHPEKAEVFFLKHRGDAGVVSVLSCDLRTGGEVELFAEARVFLSYWNLFRVQFSCWPTSIPKYKELRVMYDGSCSCWIQSNIGTDGNTHSILGTYYCLRFRATTKLTTTLLMFPFVAYFLIIVYVVVALFAEPTDGAGGAC
ncbi:unnamed protein product [Linum tenue]|uniref:F-box domain-containing protein n=2 Tax=Linum tenue TaxID=586396 RepID=A0AAV0HV58_9ROSI|nr:unnamed protein product [Linum tenue]